MAVLDHVQLRREPAEPAKRRDKEQAEKWVAAIAREGRRRRKIAAWRGERFAIGDQQPELADQRLGERRCRVLHARLRMLKATAPHRRAPNAGASQTPSAPEPQGGG